MPSPGRGPLQRDSRAAFGTCCWGSRRAPRLCQAPTAEPEPVTRDVLINEPEADALRRSCMHFILILYSEDKAEAFGDENEERGEGGCPQERGAAEALTFCPL